MENKALTIIGAANLVVCIALTGLVAMVATDDEPTKVAAPIKVDVQPVAYEYAIESIPDLEWGTKAQELGKQGWELVFARRATDSDNNYMYECIFKRQAVAVGVGDL